MAVVLTKEPKAYQWALPESLDVPPDELEARLDLYHDTIILSLIDKGIITTRMVSAQEISLALLRNVSLNSGLLPEGALWWQQGINGEEVALWRKPRVWPVALQIEAFKPPRRFKLPMPGLIFICQPGRAPRVYAAKKRPQSPGSAIFNAPLFNVFRDGTTCPGTNKYPDNVGEIPESFFLSFFSVAAQFEGRSKSHPDSLLKLWEELDGRIKYSLYDLIPFGKVTDIMR
jgi:hypothetical protein